METSVAERFNLLQKLRKIAHDNAAANGRKTKEQYNKKAMPHSFKIGDKVLITNDFDTTKNQFQIGKGQLKSLTLITLMPKSKLKTK